jgi:hypothetical protein
MSQQHDSSQSGQSGEDQHVQRARELLRTNAGFRDAMRQDPDAALQAHNLQLSEPVRQRVSNLDWNVSDEEMIQRSNQKMPS